MCKELAEPYLTMLLFLCLHVSLLTIHCTNDEAEPVTDALEVASEGLVHRGNIEGMRLSDPGLEGGFPGMSRDTLGPLPGCLRDGFLLLRGMGTDGTSPFRFIRTLGLCKRKDQDQCSNLAANTPGRSLPC